MEKEKVCCPKINPNDWNDKIFQWQNKPFIKAKVRTFFYIPIGFGNTIRKLDKKLQANSLNFSEGVCLSDHTSKWNMDIYVTIDKEFKDDSISYFNGNFYCKMYEGDFKDTGKWCSDYDKTLKEKGLKNKKIFMWYTTCPKCAKKYGKNYVGIFSEIE